MDIQEELKVKSLLTEWGIDQKTQQKFIDNQMDLFAIEYMDEESFKSLLTTEGMRLRFNVKRDVWVKSLKNSPSEVPVVSPAVVVDPGSIAASFTTVPDDALIVDLNGNVSTLDNFMAEDGTTLDIQLDDGSDSHLTQRTECDANTDNVDIQLHDGSDSNVTKRKRSDTNTDIVDIQSRDVSETILTQRKECDTNTTNANSVNKRKKTYDLRAVLMESQKKGKVVLKKYESDKEFVKDSTRDDLVDVILDYETKEDLAKLISRDRLKFLAEEIVQLFPTELESTYYTRGINLKTKKQTASGKLVWRYYNRRRDFVKCGAIPKDNKGSKAPSLSTSADPFAGLVIDKQITGSLNWLEHNRGDKGNWEEVLRHWNKTSLARLKSTIYGVELSALEVGNDENEGGENDGTKGAKGKKKKKTGASKQAELTLSQKSAHDYMKKYPALLENAAYMLFEIDFKALKPGVDPLSLFNEWATLSSFIVQQIQKKDPEFLEDTTLSSGEKILLVLRNLSRLFPVVSVSAHSRGKNVWRPSHTEVADAFVTVVSSALVLDEDKDKRRDKLKSLRMHLQPFVAIVGDIENPQQYLVCIDEFYYEVNSALQAVDVTFKTFFALHTPYPPEAEQIWLFLQLAVYGFETPEDGSFTGVKTRVAEYARFKKNLPESS